MDPPDFCPNCYDVLQITPLPGLVNVTVSGVSISPQAWEDIRQSGLNCPICREIRHSYLEEYPETPYNAGQMNVNYLALRVLRTGGRVGDKSRFACLELCWEAPISGFSDSRMQLRLWADEGTPASASFVDSPPLGSRTLIQLGTYVAEQLEECTKYHVSTCPQSAFEGKVMDEKELESPTRLLAVIDLPKGLYVKLVETFNAKGIYRYCALSYPWGPETKRPLRTLWGNIEEMMAGVPADSLPQLFHDAILVAKAAGITYLWVDSLCIIQDDKDDWTREAERMGSVYQNARLVIAAASSQDSTDRLDKTERPQSRTYRLPFQESNTTSDGIFKVSLLPKTTRVINDYLSGPLRTRAWPFQEWYLASRVAFFTKWGIYWKCKDDSSGRWDEQGVLADLFLYAGLGWLHLLSEYSSKHLTHPSDRLFALQGIVQLMQKSRKDRYHLGVWEEGLSQQLIWNMSGDIRPGSCIGDLPSWSWAETGGTKFWPTTYVGNFHDFCHSSTALGKRSTELTDTHIIRSSGNLLQLGIIPFPIRECCWENNWSPAINLAFSLEQSLFIREYIDFDQPNEGIRQHLIIDHEKPDDILGIASFDRYDPPHRIKCLILGWTDRHERDPFYLADGSGSSEDDTYDTIDFDDNHNDGHRDKGHGQQGEGDEDSNTEEHDTEEDESAEDETEEDDGHEFDSEGDDGGSNVDKFKEQDMSMHCSEECADEHSCFDSTDFAMCKKVYWALIVEPVDQSSTKLRRIGIACLYPHALDLLAKTEYKTYELV
ncbi:heterokaryon incompatibility protein-domain-containing protein [Triangularia verruculosa]|uniref:Heterokaryon incompatibility protein-domain-containing protein n=1 Tax=Triangularia verruculosa TaxID=2587418 RepID=A0AAN6XS56_9PEZI|nr:heterokaryon incompatibility protein-domain-containing protein [Triangularia verruculosa]